MEVPGALSRFGPHPLVDEGEAAALVAVWIEEHGSAVLRLAYSFLLDRGQAEDVFQEVFLTAYQRVPSLREPDRIRPWLLQVTANRCRDLLRSAWWRRALRLGGEPPPERAVPGPGEGQGAVVEAVWSLPTGLREVVVLHYFEGYAALEVARLLDLPEGTVHSRLHRARKLLRERLEAGEEES